MTDHKKKPARYEAKRVSNLDSLKETLMTQTAETFNTDIASSRKVTDWSRYKKVALKTQAMIRGDILATPWEPVFLDGKAPFTPKWQEGEVTPSRLDADYTQHRDRITGVGLRTGKLVGVDVDCTDNDLTEGINGVMIESLGGGAQYRRGSKGYMALYQNATPIAKLYLAFSKDGVPHKIEILGLGQQLAAFGKVAADDEKGTPAFEYKWLDGESPKDDSLFEPPTVTPETLRIFLEKVVEFLTANGCTITTKEKKEREKSTSANTGGLVDMAMLEKMLGCVDPGQGHNDCLPIVAALKHAEEAQLVVNPETLEPDENFSAKDVAAAWSRGDYQPDKEPPENYADGWAEARYDSLDGITEGGTTLATLISMACDGGYKGATRIDDLLDHAEFEDSELPDDVRKVLYPEQFQRKELLEVANAKAATDWEDSILNMLQPYKAQDPSTLPNMAWLYGTSALRGEVGITIATSGVGKTSLKLLSLYDMATASLVLEKLHKGPLRVGFISFEDNQDVLERRIEAIRKHYGGSDDVFRDRLFLKSFLGLGFRFTELNSDSVVVLNERAFSVLKKFITQNKIDYLCMDPWVHMHEFPESENVQIAKLVERIKGIASKTKCFIDIVHHTRKTMHGQSETTQEDSRGASSLVNATRVKRIISPMSVGEASKCKILELERWRYVKIVDGNVNHSPRRTGGEWYKKIGVKLGNAQKPSDLAPGEIPYEEDDVGVMQRVELATVSMLVSEAQVVTILQTVTATPHREDNQAKGEPRLVDAIAEATGLRWEDNTVRPTLKTIKARLLDYKVLAREERNDKNRKPKFYVVLGSQPCLPEHVVEPPSEVEDDGDDF